MHRHSEAFGRLRRQVARRRREFLRNQQGRTFTYPSAGTVWFPSHREQAHCEAFIVLFVAELETYWEAVVNAALDSFNKRFLASGLHDCGAAEAYVSKITQQRQQWQKNNNANWSRIESYFNFVGLNKSKFPDGLWDNVEAVVVQRGDIVHNSLGIRSTSDPRITLNHIENILLRLTIFDRDFVDWLRRADAELTRLQSVQSGFVAGMGTLSVG
jgi:hypothetical protein